METSKILDMCGTQHILKQKKSTEKGRADYREINKKIRKQIKEAKQVWNGK